MVTARLGPIHLWWDRGRAILGAGSGRVALLAIQRRLPMEAVHDLMTLPTAAVAGGALRRPSDALDGI